jgi:hypothetical protein
MSPERSDICVIPDWLQHAVAEYRTALRLDPDASTVHNNLRYALSKMPQGPGGAIPGYRRETVRMPARLH